MFDLAVSAVTSLTGIVLDLDHHHSDPLVGRLLLGQFVSVSRGATNKWSHESDKSGLDFSMPGSPALQAKSPPSVGSPRVGCFSMSRNPI